MRITVIPSSAMVGVDGRFVTASCDFPPGVHAIQIYDESAEIEYEDGRPNRIITDPSELGLMRSRYQGAHATAMAQLAAATPPNRFSVWDAASSGWVLDRDALCRQLELDMHDYIFTTHGYPQPSQITLQAIYSDPESTAAQRSAVKEIFDWVKSVLAYYYARKQEILTAGDPEGAAWNFAAACDATAPGYTLAQVIQMGA